MGSYSTSATASRNPPPLPPAALFAPTVLPSPRGLVLPRAMILHLPIVLLHVLPILRFVPGRGFDALAAWTWLDARIACGDLRRPPHVQESNAPVATGSTHLGFRGPFDVDGWTKRTRRGWIRPTTKIANRTIGRNAREFADTKCGFFSDVCCISSKLGKRKRPGLGWSVEDERNIELTRKKDGRTTQRFARESTKHEEECVLHDRDRSFECDNPMYESRIPCFPCAHPPNGAS